MPGDVVDVNFKTGSITVQSSVDPVKYLFFTEKCVSKKCFKKERLMIPRPAESLVKRKSNSLQDVEDLQNLEYCLRMFFSF